MASTNFVSGTTIASTWLNDVNTLVYKGQSGNVGGTDRTALTKLAETVSVKDFGAVGNFDPSTGTGTDDRVAIQAAFTYAMGVTGGCVVVFPPGRYYGGASAGALAGGVQIALGSSSSFPSAKNIVVEGFGAELYQGAAGRFLGIFGADRVMLRGLKIFGYTGGTLGATRQNDALITVNYTSRNVKITDCYLTNGLGDQIYVGGTLVGGGGTGSETRNIEICDNVIKTRVGNGTSSFTGGTMSRTAIAAVDVVGCNIHDNDVYGTIDLEPNLDGQHIVDVQLHDNKFKSGFVTPQAVIGTAYWFDEPIGLSGGTEIIQAVTLTGVPGAPVVTGNNIRHNTFENGYISDYNVYVFDRVDGNVFQKGQIRVGSTSGTNDTAGRAITRNRAIAPLTGETTFIRLDGKLQQSEISGNDAGSAFTYVINNPAGGATGDLGRLRILNNTIQNTGTRVNNVTLLGTSVEFGSIATVGSFNAATANSMQVTDMGSPHTSVTIAGTNLVLNWLTYRGSNWRTSEIAAATNSIAQITNPQYDGQELTINCGASGGGSLTFIHNASFIRCKGAVNAVLSAENIIVFQARAGIWFEKSRSF